MATTATNVWWSEMMQSAAMTATAIAAIPSLPTITDNGGNMYVGLSYPGNAQFCEGIFDEQLKTSNCKNCAAPLNWFKQSCEYCGTFYAK